MSVDFGGMRPEEVAIELYASAVDGKAKVKQEMKKEGENRYVAAVPNDREANLFTARAIPRHPDLILPLELPLISWQK